MCGIAGFTRFQDPTGDDATLRAMGAAIIHRGPDAGGEYIDQHVGLCHRRLSIIDLSAAGNQPMYSQDQNQVIVFNGEIYNFQELREELLGKGYQFQTKCDTEVLLVMYQEYGEELVKKINGMYAFAIWDKNTTSLFLARDRLGKKPLYYYHGDGKFVFGSELKSILALPEIPREIDDRAVSDFFTYQYIPDPKSIFLNISKLEPGHTLTVTEEGIVKKQYWDLSFAKQTSSSEEEAADELLKVIEECVKSRMISDVPLGAFLSGGVDSSGIVALMAKNSSEPVTTCSIGFDSEQFDEVKYAAEIASQFNTNHNEFTVHQNVEQNLEKIVSYFDEPFADPSLVPTFYVSKLARQTVTVALAGDGGDENFAGYEKYAVDALENKFRRVIPRFLRRSLFPGLVGLLSGSNSKVLMKARTLLASLSNDPGYGFFLTNSFMSETLWASLVNDEFKNRLGGYCSSTVTTDCYQKADGPDHLSKILYTDFKTYLPGGILVKVDRMSMANSLEVRAPLLDYTVVEFAAKIPSKMKLKGKSKKHILKRAFSKLLSDDILYRKKMGFSVPLADWLREEINGLAEQYLFMPGPGLGDYFRTDQVRKIWDLHQSGARDYSSELWSMLIFQLWYKQYMEPR